MGRYDINPRTKLPVKDEESDLPIDAYHGRLHSFILSLIPILKVIFRVKKPIGIENIPKSGGLVIAGNHSRWTNPIVVQSVVTDRKLFYLGKSSLLKWPVIGSVVMSLGSIPVDRSVHNSGARSYASQQLKKGGALLIFPEGTSNRDKKMLPFKFGAVSIAYKANVPIVPMAIWKGKTMFASPIKAGKDLEKTNEQLRQIIDKMRSELMRKKIVLKHTN